MTQKKELQSAYALAGILLVVGIFSYIAASFAEPPIPPLRMMYQTVAGRVLLDHKAHFSPEGYGISCQDCHHDLRTIDDYIQMGEEDRSVPEAGSNLTDAGETEEVKVYKNGDEAHKLCIGCHEEDEAGPLDCRGCHVPV